MPARFLACAGARWSEDERMRLLSVIYLVPGIRSTDDDAAMPREEGEIVQDRAEVADSWGKRQMGGRSNRGEEISDIRPILGVELKEY